MDDRSALLLALGVARAFLAGERSPLATARAMTGIVNPWRSWWIEMDGGKGPLSIFYAADDAGTELPWLGDELELWHEDVREAKLIEAAAAEARWRLPVKAACDALIAYGSSTTSANGA